MDGTTIFLLVLCVYGMAWAGWSLWDDRRRCDMCGGRVSHSLKCPDSPYYLLEMMSKGQPWGWQRCHDSAETARMLRRLDQMMSFFAPA